MGSRIACHFANIGVQVLLLDIPPRELSEDEKKKGKELNDPAVRNRIVNNALMAAIKSNPSPLYRKAFASRITTGNLEDDLSKVKECDWILEAVIERLDIKQQVFENVEKFRKPGSLITSNTSGIPIHLMLEGRSEDFKKHFCGTHFFNPPRYLKLLELIPTPETDPEVINFLKDYGERYLGKTTIETKDTPAFIANRIGVFSIQSLFHTVKEMGLSVEDVDKLTGTVLGRPKSATFRTCDVVGLDTLAHVAKGLEQNCPDDEAKDVFTLPGYVQKMVENNWLGSKSGQGFYKKVKNDKGESEILSLDLNTLEYKAQSKSKFPTLDAAKAVDNLKERMPVLISGKDKAGEFYRNSFYRLFTYVSHRVPEIADEPYKIDEAMEAGFGWQLGPFEVWDSLGVRKTAEAMVQQNIAISPWVKEMLDKGFESFYSISDGVKKYYHPGDKEMKTVPGSEKLLSLEILRSTSTIWKNSGSTITDLGDGILNLEFHTKMNTLGSEVIEGLNKAIDLAEQEYAGLVISNEGENFSAGANLGLVFMMASSQEFDEVDFAVRTFQNVVMRVRYSAIPVVVAPHGMALGGGCEISMHADKVVAHAETYMGLVEFGAGLIPAGGGTKEFALRLSDHLQEGDIRSNSFRHSFLTIGQAKVSTSAHEAFDLGYLRKGRDIVVVSRARLLTEAKAQCLLLAEAGYTMPVKREDITVLGREGLGLVYAGANSMKSGHYISEHDQKISEMLGFVLAGGELSEPSKVSEDYLLELERKAFVRLCQERKTLERMQGILTGGKIVRN